MSLWSAESPVLAIAPGSAALLRRRGGKKEIVVSEQRDPTRLLPQLETLFGKGEWKTGQVDVVFSHKLVRHVLTAPPGKALKSIEEIALARAALIDVFGEEASAWRVRTLSQPPQYGILGAGVDEALCGGLENLGQRHGWTARLRPLAAALPEARGAASADAWFVVEPGWATLFLGARGHWRHVAARAIGDDWREALPEWLARAADSHGFKPRQPQALVQTVGLASAKPPALEGWRWQLVQTAAGEADALALAMGCA